MIIREESQKRAFFEITETFLREQGVPFEKSNGKDSILINIDPTHHTDILVTWLSKAPSFIFRTFSSSSKTATAITDLEGGNPLPIRDKSLKDDVTERLRKLLIVKNQIQAQLPNFFQVRDEVRKQSGGVDMPILSMWLDFSTGKIKEDVSSRDIKVSDQIKGLRFGLTNPFVDDGDKSLRTEFNFEVNWESKVTEAVVGAEKNAQIIVGYVHQTLKDFGLQLVNLNALKGKALILGEICAFGDTEYHAYSTREVNTTDYKVCRAKNFTRIIPASFEQAAQFVEARQRLTRSAIA
jgi:hypothetical protein